MPLQTVSRAKKTLVKNVPPEYFKTLSASEYAVPRSRMSGLTSVMRAPPASVRSASSSSTASVKNMFVLLKTGNGAEISDMLNTIINDSPDKLTKTDRQGNNALHYLAQNTTISPHTLAELLFLYGDDIEYKANAKGETPVMIALATYPDFGLIQLLFSEESGLNHPIGKNKTMLHYLYKNTALPIEDLVHINSQLFKSGINTDKIGSALPVLAANLVSRFDIQSPPRKGLTISKVPTKNDIAIQLFYDTVMRFGVGEKNQSAINETKLVLKEAMKEATDTKNRPKENFIKNLARPLFIGTTQSLGKTREPFGTLLEGGKKKPVQARAAPLRQAK